MKEVQEVRSPRRTDVLKMARKSVSAVEPNKAVMRRKPLDWDQIYRDMAKMANFV
jgi:hypothetical protein